MTLTPDELVSQRTALVSAQRDPERLRLSYTEHTATALRRRALAAGNGHGDIRATRHPSMGQS